jgi:putative flippase GtrA
MSRREVNKDKRVAAAAASSSRRRSNDTTARGPFKSPVNIRTALWDLASSLLLPTPQINVTERMLRHLVVGGTATLFYLMLLVLLVELLNMHPVLATCVAFLVMEIFIYAANWSWVHEPTLGHRSAVARYIVAIVVALALNSGIMALTVDVLGLWYIWGLAAAVLILPVTNFLLNSYWVFR